MRKFWVLAALLFTALVLSSCSERTRGYKSVVEWSRGQIVGLASQADPVALQITADGQRIVLVWAASPDRETQVLRLVVLDGQGQVLTDRDLAVDVVLPTQPRLALDGDDRIHVAWLDEVGKDVNLFHAAFSLEGQVLEQPRQLSEPGFRVSSHKIAVLPSGKVLEIWSTRLGIHAARIETDDQVQYASPLETEWTVQLDYEVDEEGLVHIAWQGSRSPAERQLLYTYFELDTFEFSWPMYFGTEMLRTGPSMGGSAQQVEGPTIALEADRITMSWTVSEVRGTRGDAFSLSFVPGESKEPVTRRIVLPAAYPADYAPSSGLLPYRQLAPALPSTAAAYGAEVRGTPSTVTGRNGEVPLALSMQIRTDWSAEFQPALAVLEAEKATGYQVVGMTGSPSLSPVLAADADGQLYMAWVDARGREYPVYLATTAPAVRAAWDRLSSSDLALALEQLFGRIISAAGVALLGISWLILPGFFLVITLFIFREDYLYTSRGWIVLYVLTGMHWAGKLLLTGDLLNSLPKLRDLPLLFPWMTLLAPETLAYLPNQLGLPSGVSALMPFVLPGLTLVAGALVARVVYLRRVKEPHAIPAYLIMAAVDVFLAIEIYALTHYDPMQF
ncbi:MAG: hypothetical protein PVJ26_17965 [Anaerolineae bacterium]|jgi:hypothetical protein